MHTIVPPELPTPTREPASVGISPLAPTWPETCGTVGRGSNLLGSSRGLALARAAETHPGPILVVAGDARTAHELEDEIRFYLTDSTAAPILPLPDWESLPYEAFSPHPDIISDRLLTLYRLPELTRGIILVTATTLQHRLAPRALRGRRSTAPSRRSGRAAVSPKACSPRATGRAFFDARTSFQPI